MRQDFAIVYTVDLRPEGLELLKESAKSFNRFYPDVPVFVMSKDGDERTKVSDSVTVLKTPPAPAGVSFEGAVPDVGSRYTDMAYDRLLIPYSDELQHFDLILYVDVDVEACSRDETLFTFDMGSKWFAAALDVQDFGLHHSVKWGTAFYVNTGVMLVNMRQVANGSGGYTEWLVDASRIARKNRPRHVDQDVLNLTASEHILLFPQKFNVLGDLSYEIPRKYWVFRHYVTHARGLPASDDSALFKMKRKQSPLRSVDVLYVVANKSSDGWRDLRYSLRGLSKFGRSIRNVVIAGHTPYWVSDAVIRVPYEQKGPKHNRMFRSIAAAVDAGAVNGRFMFLSDDHFYTKPVDFAKHPVFCRAKSLPRPGTEKPTKYWKDLAYTYKVLEEHGLPVQDFSGHVGGVFDTADLDVARKLYDEQPEELQVIEPYCAFVGARMVRAPEPITMRKDIKLPADATPDQIRHAARDLCFSTSDGIWNSSFYRRFMNDIYGAGLCKYERIVSSSIRVTGKVPASSDRTTNWKPGKQWKTR